MYYLTNISLFSHMSKPVLNYVTPEVLQLFELFDWWQPSRLSDETGIGLDKLKSLIRLRKDFKLHADAASVGLTQTQIEIATSFSRQISLVESKALTELLPVETGGDRFKFIDLFAGIGGIRRPFDDIGGRCVLTCEWDEYAQRTYKANWKSLDDHTFISDIKEITQPKDKGGASLSGRRQISSIQSAVPGHHILLAGFPCQPFSIAGVSKKNALNRSHGFECEDQGQLFFDICRILCAKQPAIAVLENVKNLKSHDKGNTFRVITEMLTNLPSHQQTLFGRDGITECSGYWIANLDDNKPDHKVIDGQHFVPQHRERVILLCIRKDLLSVPNLTKIIDLSKISIPDSRKTLKDVLDKNSEVEEKYTLTPKLWKYLEDYALKHKAKGNGFGYGMVYRNRKNSIARTLSARYYKDGSEILINQEDVKKRPRRLTPQECARLMGFVDKEQRFRIPVSDTRGYKQFGNSVVVPVFGAIAKLIEPCLDTIVQIEEARPA